MQLLDIHQAWNTPKLKLHITKIVTREEHIPVPNIYEFFLILIPNLITLIQIKVIIIIPIIPNSSHICRKLL